MTLNVLIKLWPQSQLGYPYQGFFGGKFLQRDDQKNKLLRFWRILPKKFNHKIERKNLDPQKNQE